MLSTRSRTLEDRIPRHPNHTATCPDKDLRRTWRMRCSYPPCGSAVGRSRARWVRPALEAHTTNSSSSSTGRCWPTCAVRYRKAGGGAIRRTRTLLRPWLQRRHRHPNPIFTTSTLAVPATILDSRQQGDLRERAHNHVFWCSLAGMRRGYICSRTCGSRSR
ncbi:hypothetical protein BC826DRAFT_1049346 [Russula brevipes]|nr:hypothetical protein BC826DRAFT_1049346 [Russula brevipes]